MADQRYEYHAEPMYASPDELRNDTYRIEETLNELAGDGWALESTLRVDSSTFLFVFSRPVEA